MTDNDNVIPTEDGEVPMLALPLPTPSKTMDEEADLASPPTSARSSKRAFEDESFMSTDENDECGSFVAPGDFEYGENDEFDIEDELARAGMDTSIDPVEDASFGDTPVHEPQVEKEDDLSAGEVEEILNEILDTMSSETVIDSMWSCIPPEWEEKYCGEDSPFLENDMDEIDRMYNFRGLSFIMLARAMCALLPQGTCEIPRPDYVAFAIEQLKDARVIEWLIHPSYVSITVARILLACNLRAFILTHIKGHLHKHALLEVHSRLMAHEEALRNELCGYSQAIMKFSIDYPFVRVSATRVHSLAGVMDVVYREREGSQLEVESTRRLLKSRPVSLWTLCPGPYRGTCELGMKKLGSWGPVRALVRVEEKVSKQNMWGIVMTSGSSGEMMRCNALMSVPLIARPTRVELTKLSKRSQRRLAVVSLRDNAAAAKKHREAVAPLSPSPKTVVRREPPPAPKKPVGVSKRTPEGEMYEEARTFLHGPDEPKNVRTTPTALHDPTHKEHLFGGGVRMGNPGDAIAKQKRWREERAQHKQTGGKHLPLGGLRPVTGGKSPYKFATSSQ